MKRSLDVVSNAAGEARAVSVEVDLGRTRVRISAVGHGQEAERFAEMLTNAGGRLPTDRGPAKRLDVVIRTTVREREALRQRAELEETADVVLGSPRPALAERLAATLLGD